MADVPERLLTRIYSGRPCWDAGLDGLLVDDFWSGRSDAERDRYRTAAWLGERVEGERFPVPGHLPMWVEPLPKSLARRFDAPASAQAAALMARGAGAAMTRLGGTGPAGSIGTLVRAIHCVEAPGPGYDLSHSEPTIPFSVLLSNPAGERHADLRLAESLLHEAMHLQLTLVERYAPIADQTAASGFSPWQRRQRPVHGLLHGLYVFTAIRRWLGGLLSDPSLSEEDAVYANRRIREIDGEVAEVSALRAAEGLTAFGRALVAGLLGTVECDAGPPDRRRAQAG